MSKKFVIGDRLKDEWISVLDTEKKKLEFTNHLASAKEYLLEEDAQISLQKIKNEIRVKRLFFTKASFLLLRWGCRYPRIVRWIFEKKMKQEFWIGN